MHDLGFQRLAELFQLSLSVVHVVGLDRCVYVTPIIVAVPDFDEDRLVGVDQFGFVFGDQEALVGVVGADGLPEVRKAIVELSDAVEAGR